MVDRLYAVSLTLLLLTMVVVTVADARELPFTTYRHSVQTFTEAEGLPSPQVNQLGQDGSRQIWAATNRGLVGYDGQDWFPAELPALPEGAREINLVATDSEGHIWAAIGSGRLVRQISERGFELISADGVPMAVAGNTINSLSIQGQGENRRVFLGTSQTGMYELVGDEWSPITPPNGPVARTILHTTQWGDTIYVATGEGFGQITPERGFEWLNLDALGLPNAKLRSLAVETQPCVHPGRIWFVFDTVIGYVVDGLGSPFHEVAATPPLPETRWDPGMITVPDGAGGLLFGLAERQYRLSADGNIHTLGQPSGLLAPGATDVFRDRENTIWVSSYRGISKIRSLLFETVDRELGLLEDEVSALAEGPDGTLYVGHNQGLSIVHPDRIEHMPIGTGDPELYPRIMDLVIGPDGNLWIAASHLGLGRLDARGQLRWFPFEATPLAPPRQQAMGLAFDSSAGPEIEDQLRVLSYSNLWSLRGDKLVLDDRYTPGTQGRQIVPAEGGGFWISNHDSILIRLQGDDIQSFPNSPEFDGAGSAFAILPSPDGSVLAGTETGLVGLWGGQFHEFRPGGTPVNRPIYALLRGPDEHLWIGTDHGLLRWDGQQLRTFAIHEGLGGLELNRNAMLVDHTGTLWVGTNGGLSRFNAEFSHPALQPPRPSVTLSHVIIGGDSLRPGDRISVPHGRDITLTYRSVSHLRGGNVTYRTLLRRVGQVDGIEIETPIRQIHYPNLRPGRYEFRVVAVNDMGQVSDAAVFDSLRVELPLYQQPLFLAAVAVLILGVGLLGVQYYVARRTAARLEHQVEERTRQLREQSEAYRSLVQNAVFGIVQVDAGGQIKSTNHALLRLLACDSEDKLLAMNVRDHIMQDAQAWDRLFQHGRQDGHIDRERVVWNRCDGDQIIVRLTGRITREDSTGEPYAELFVEDITDSLRAQNAQIEAERLRDVQKLAIAVAHEFNNPLSILLGSYQLFLQPKLNEFDDISRDRLERLPEIINRMKDLVDKLLRLTRLKEEEYISGTSFLNLSKSSSDDEDSGTGSDRVVTDDPVRSESAARRR